MVDHVVTHLCKNIMKHFNPVLAVYSNELVTCRKCISKSKDVQQSYICNKAVLNVFDVLECNYEFDSNTEFGKFSSSMFKGAKQGAITYSL